MDLNLRGKKVAVTGAAGSLGAVFVKDLVQHGAIVYAVSRTASKLEALKKAYPSIIPILCDQTKWDETERTLTEQLPDDLDMLVNNAGAAISETLEELTEAGVDEVLNINFKGTLITTKVVVKKMIANGNGGSIVNISSITSSFPFSFLLAYGMTKAGIDRLTKTLATQLGPHKIRVNAVNPTVIYGTEMGDMVFETDEKKAMVKKLTPLPDLPTHQHVSNAVLFYLSDQAVTLTGQITFVDSGVHGG